METILALVSAFSANAGEIISGALIIIGAFSAIATATPNKSDDAFFQSLLTWINRLGMNAGRAKNAE